MDQLPTTMRRRNETPDAGGIRTTMVILAGCAMLLGFGMDAAAKSVPRYCVAQREASEEAVKAALVWACTTGGQSQNPACAESKCLTTYERADIIFNVYYKRHQPTQQDGACDFKGAAQLSTGEPNKYFDFAKNTLTPCS
jgi:hypothetical protein